MKKILALLLALIIALTGCTTKAPTTTTPPVVENPTDAETPSDENIAAVQEYKSVYSGELTTLNYLVTASTNEFGVAANLVDTLVDYDKYGVVKPALATEWTVSPDNLVWTFKLREGVKWVTNEGKEYAEVVAQDFVDSIEYILDPTKESSTANIVYSVLANAQEFYDGEITDFAQVGVKAKDKYTVEYTLKNATPYFLSMMTYVCFFPVNGQFLEEVGDQFGTDNETLLYNGAYILDVLSHKLREY